MENNMEVFSRAELLIGKAALDRLSQARVAVFGVGGVGGFVVEALARGGVRNAEVRFLRQFFLYH